MGETHAHIRGEGCRDTCRKGQTGDPAKMIEGRYVGTHNRYGSILAMTSRGVIVGTGYHSLPEIDKWGQLEPDLKGSPLNVEGFALKKPEVEERLVVVPAAAPDAAPAEALEDDGQPEEQRAPVGMPSG